MNCSVCRRRYVSFLSGLILISFLASCTEAPEISNEEEWISLFNGRDIDEWIVKIAGHELGDNYQNTFQVQDSVLVVDYSGYDDFESRFGILMYPKPFSFYRLAVEYRFVGEQLSDGPDWAIRNSGIMIHSQSAASMMLEQDFPISIEVQLLGGNGVEKRSTANLCTPGTNVVMDGGLVTRHCTNSTSETYHGDGWVRVEIEVLGQDRIVHRLDGEVVLEYEQPQLGGGSVSGQDPDLGFEGQLLSGGFIGLQSESHPVQFRSVELLKLRGCMNPASPRYRSFFVVSDPVAC